VMPVRV